MLTPRHSDISAAGTPILQGLGCSESQRPLSASIPNATSDNNTSLTTTATTATTATTTTAASTTTTTTGSNAGGSTPTKTKPDKTHGYGYGMQPSQMTHQHHESSQYHIVYSGVAVAFSFAY